MPNNSQKSVPIICFGVIFSNNLSKTHLSHDISYCCEKDVLHNISSIFMNSLFIYLNKTKLAFFKSFKCSLVITVNWKKINPPLVLKEKLHCVQ